MLGAVVGQLEKTKVFIPGEMFHRGIDVGDDHVAQGAHETFNQEIGLRMVGR